MVGKARHETLDVDEPADKMPPLAQPEVWWALDKRKRKDGGYYAVPTPLNVTRILSADSRWFDRIRLNEFSGAVEIWMPGDDLEAPPRTLSDVVATWIVHWLDQHYGIVVTEERVGRECNAIADRKPYNPVRDYLDGLRWDGKPRAEALICDYFGGEDTELNRVLSRSWLISAVARVMEPGCKVDTVLILVGQQGGRKSKAFEVLGAPWYSNSALDYHSKDLYENIHGVWIYELAELDGFRRADWSRVKATITSSQDRYRRPYGKSSEWRKRSCVFGGSINEQEFLGDPTGSRRFWPVAISGGEGEAGGVDEAALRCDRDQLWAEAVAAYRAGIPWWLEGEWARELREASEQFQDRHPWYELIARWLVGYHGQVTIEAALTEAVQVPAAQRKPRDATDVGRIFSQLGLVKRRQMVRGVRSYAWEPRKPKA